MRLKFWKSLLGAGCMLAALNVSALPLQRAAVMQEPAWVAHFDVDALRPTVVGQYIFQELEKPEARKKLAALQAVINFDVRQGLHGITLYGPTASPQDGVALVYAGFDAARLTTLAEAAEEHRATRHREYEIHSWVEKKKHRGKERTYGAIHKNRVVIFGHNEARVAEALDVLDNLKPSLAASQQFAGLGANGQAIVLEASARKLNLPASDPSAAVFKHSKAVSLQISEAQRQFQAVAALHTESEEIAQQLTSVVRGLVALLGLRKDPPEAAKLAQAIEVQQAGTSVHGVLAMPADALVEILKAREMRKEARKQAAAGQ